LKDRLLPWAVWGGLTAVILVIAAAYLRSSSGSNPAKTRGSPLVLSQLSDFVLTNQFNQRVCLEDLRGKVWVADIIFTRCPGPCAYISRRMREIQEAVPADWPVRLVSLTTDPEFDTPEILRSYAKRFQADPARWQFLTGTKPAIKQLAVDGLKLVLLEKKPEQQESPNDLFIHSTLMVVVDKQGRVRAAFQTLPATPDEASEEALPASDSGETDAFAKTKEEIVKTVRELAGE
jgi:cytochrome oxidase Cu insertion factor (SCO1/SenC/PrrC family)